MSLELIIPYIQRERAAGRDDLAIKAALVARAWNPDLIDQGFTVCNEVLTPALSGNLTGNTKPVSTDDFVLVDDPNVQTIPDAVFLIKESLRAFKKSWWMYLAGSALLVATNFFSSYIMVSVMQPAVTGIGKTPPLADGSMITRDLMAVMASGLIVGLIMSVFGVWINIYYYYVLVGNGRDGIGECLAKAFKSLKAVLWVHILVVLVSLGGTFVLIGIFFSIWYSAAYLVVLTDRVSGIAALKRSKFYIRKRFTVIVWRIVVFSFLMSCLILPISIVTSLFSQNHEMTNLARESLNFILMAPLLMIFITKLFGYVKIESLKEDGHFIDDGKTKSFKIYAVIGLFGVTLLTFVMGAMMMISFSKLNDLSVSQEQIDQATGSHVVLVSKQIQSSMDEYFTDYDRYPDTFMDLVPKYYPSEPQNILLKEPYEYTYIPLKNNRSYRFCIKYDMGMQQKCVEPLDK